MLHATLSARLLLTLAVFVVLGLMLSNSTMAQSTAPVYPAVQMAVDSPANVVRTADLRTTDSGAVQVEQVRWYGRGYGYGGYARGYGYAPYRAYYPNRYYSYYSPSPYYYGTPYSSYYSAPYYQNYRFPNYGYYYGPRVAVRPYARWWW